MFVIKSFGAPLVWVLSSLFLGLALMRYSRKKPLPTIGRYLVFLGALTLLLLSFPPFANVLTYSLESRVPAPTPNVLSTLDIIVVLGGGGHPSGGFRCEAELANRAYPRLYHAVRVFRRSHAAKLAFCGGEIREGKEREADIMKAMAMQLGVSEDRILTETNSRNTMENASRLVEQLAGQSGRRIGLVTTATHMFRSARTFRRQFPADTVVPIPVHHRYDPDPWRIKGLRPSVTALEESTAAIHEWIGLIWYAIRY